MDFTFDVGYVGIAVLVVGAVIFGIGAQFFGEARTGYEWIASSIGAFIGGFVASEFITGVRSFEPVLDRLALVPALVGGLLVGIVVVAAARLLISDQYAEHGV